MLPEMKLCAVRQENLWSLLKADRYDDLLASYRAELEVTPNSADIHNDIGALLHLSVEASMRAAAWRSGRDSDSDNGHFDAESEKLKERSSTIIRLLN